MPRNGDTFLDRLLFRRSLKRWREMADAAETTDLDHLQRQQGRARSLRHQIDRLLHVAGGRMAQPQPGVQAVMDTSPYPLGTDWVWRPAPWQGPLVQPGQTHLPATTAICDGVTLFHDCRDSEMSWRQIRNLDQSDRAPFGLGLDVFAFDGSFLSMVLDLPPDAARGLRLKHILRLDLNVALERPIGFVARLNIKHGPNVEQITRELRPEDGIAVAEFDLAYSRMNEKRVEKLWIDLIFDGPAMNRITLRDTTVSRRPRAEL